MISVCMATYNGEKYILEQMNSILQQLAPDDELIISDDGSTDKTISIIQSLQDSRLKFYKNNFKNVVKNFEFAIAKSVGDFVFLSDQDDIWHKEKRADFLKCFKSENADLVVSNVAFINGDGVEQSMKFYNNGFRSGVMANMMKNNFIGCSMAFTKEVKTWILPFPVSLPMHDWWIGLVVGKRGKVSFLDKELLYYRRHDTNVTTGERSSLINILRWRWILAKNLFTW